MSAIASFTKLPLGALPGLQEAAVPKKRFLKSPLDTYHEYLKAHGKEVAEYPRPGYVLATLLVYLDEEHQVDLMKSAHNELSDFLTNARGATSFVLTHEHKTMYLEQLASPVAATDLRDYYNEFNEVDEPNAGLFMQEGIAAFRQALGSIDEGSVVLVQIG